MLTDEQLDGMESAAHGGVFYLDAVLDVIAQAREANRLREELARRTVPTSSW